MPPYLLSSFRLLLGHVAVQRTTEKPYNHREWPTMLQEMIVQEERTLRLSYTQIYVQESHADYLYH